MVEQVNNARSAVSSLRHSISKLLRDESGLEAGEYALVAVILLIIAGGVFATFGTSIQNAIQQAAMAISGTGTAAPTP